MKGSNKGNPKFEKVYSVTEVAKLLNTDRRTVFKWMAEDPETGEAIIPREAYFKLPRSGYIRIKQWIVTKLLKEMG